MSQTMLLSRSTHCCPLCFIAHLHGLWAIVFHWSLISVIAYIIVYDLYEINDINWSKRSKKEVRNGDGIINKAWLTGPQREQWNSPKNNQKNKKMSNNNEIQNGSNSSQIITIYVVKKEEDMSFVWIFGKIFIIFENCRSLSVSHIFDGMSKDRQLRYAFFSRFSTEWNRTICLFKPQWKYGN